MAGSKKYANLPDLDIAAPEIYETPELTDGASTAPTGTVRTDSPSPSDEAGDERLDRQRIDQDSARRRFEPSLVNAKDVNFGDTVDGDERISYRTKNRRRRRRGYEGDSEDESDEETLGAKIARLKREAEEVKLELARREEGEFKDSVEEQDGAGSEAENADELSRLMSGLRGPSRTSGGNSTEQTFLKSISNGTGSKKPNEQRPLSSNQPDPASSSTNAAIAAFSDRLTALESALGLSTIDATAQPASILPTLASLSTQLTTLTSTLTSSNTPSTSAPLSLPNLDTLQSRIHALTAEADKLFASRKAALASLNDLHDARIRYNTSRHTRTHSRPTSSHQNGPLQNIEKQESDLHSGLFLEEQASKINALYQILPTIQGLQPLLPTVLERLRSLNVIHAGAAEARGELDEVTRRQGETREDVRKWREAVESVEKKMAEMGQEMKENVDVVGGMVRGVEERVKSLGKA